MSAKRYSGNATITAALDDSFDKREPGRQSYKVSITQGRARIKPMFISAPIRGGSGVSVDSPIMIDEVAQSALSFGVHDGTVSDDGNDLDYSEEGYYQVYRKKQSWHPK